MQAQRADSEAQICTQTHTLCHMLTMHYLFTHNFCQNIISSLEHVNPPPPQGAPLSPCYIKCRIKNMQTRERTYLAQSLKAGGI